LRRFKGRANNFSQSTIMTIFKSRTFWTLVAGFVINVYQAFSAQLPPAVVGIADAVVLILGTYFHVNPSQTYAPASKTPPQA
jgi:hypothetical protein